MDEYDHMRATRAIQDFVGEDLSNWYIRRARRRFWGEGMTDDKKAVYATTYELLVGISKLIAPFAPFLSDEMYINLTGEESVHLDYFPEADESLIDPAVEERMDLVRTLVALGRGTREKEKIKVRQPLESVLIDGKYEDIISDLTPLIKEELNIKQVIFEKDLDEYMNFSLKPNFRVAGPALGKNIKAFGAAMAKADPKEVMAAFDADGKLTVELNGENVDITPDMVEVRIDAKEGFAVAMENNVFTILDTTITPELEAEGLARELISKVQQMRKQNDYEMMDNIKIYLDADEDVAAAVDTFKDYIMKETLAVEICGADEAGAELNKVNLNGHKSGLALERI
jgi:isoleucyl-tRNA synthetase